MKKSFYLLIIVFFLFECDKKNNFSEIPHIEFLYWQRIEESQDEIVFSFTDADGDIGEIIKSRSDCKNKNIQLKAKIKKNNTVTDYNPDFEYCFQVDGVSSEQEKGIEGEISLHMLHLFYPKISEADEILFEIFIVDTKGNQSNTIETPWIIVP